MDITSGEGRTREEILRDFWTVVMAALDEAAEARMERIDAGSCPECVESSDGLCETHGEDRARADEYRQTWAELEAVLHCS
jgi:hypothetical protein